MHLHESSSAFRVGRVRSRRGSERAEQRQNRERRTRQLGQVFHSGECASLDWRRARDKRLQQARLRRANRP
jgi:hypothetical protein